MHRYQIIIYWSKDDDAFVAEVPELPGCAADGPARAAALKSVDVIIKEWLKPYVDFDGSPEELAERPTMLGLDQ